MKRFIFNNFRFYWKSHLGLLFGAFLTSTILSGSLVVGDSVRASLRRAAAERLGSVQSAVLGGDRWFTDKLARDSGGAPAILLRGSVSAANGQARVNTAQVIGIDDDFTRFALDDKTPAPADSGTVSINESLALHLQVSVGDTIIIRLEAPSAISRDAPLSGSTNEEVTLRRKVAAVLPAGRMGDFQLAAAQTPLDNVFVPLKDLQQAVERPGMVNAALFDHADSDLQSHATLADYDLKLNRVQGQGSEWEVATGRVFLDDSLAVKILSSQSGSRGVLTYLVNGLSSATGRTPYSMVTAVDLPTPANPAPATSAVSTDAAANDPATITQWLAEDLGLAIGDTFDLRYFSVGLGRELVEQSAQFRVGGILPMTDPLVNRTWTPNFPGVSDADNCRDWQPGIPVKLDAIRDKDEKYWDDYKGTPKAFISLEAGRRLWTNRFGSLTSVRFPDTGQNEAELAQQIASQLRLTDIGLTPRQIAAEAAAAAKGSVDFGGLFIGLSLFLIAAALVFAALLFLFTLEKRVPQLGVLLSVGWTQRQVRSSLLAEAAIAAVIGSALGIGGGVLYTKLALAGLSSVWSGAVVGLRLFYETSAPTLSIAFVASLLASLGTLWWASRKIFRTPAKDLLAGNWSPPPARGRAGAWKKVAASFLPWICLLLAGLCSVLGSRASSPEAVAGMFFGAGFLLLAAGLMFLRGLLLKPSLSGMLPPSIRNIVRRPGRSLSVIGMMAGGLFLVIAVNAFRLGASSDPTNRASGTGGFTLLGESTLPIYEDLNGEAAWDAFALDEKVMKKVKVVPFRVREGDDASCLNLNRAQLPTLTGVNPRLLDERGAFVFAKGSWKDLLPPSPEQCAGHSRTAALAEQPIPAVADQATAMWGLGKGVGDTLDFTDSAGRPFQVKLVALLVGSVLQGKIIVSEQDYLKKYPDAAGYRFFLMDTASPDDAAAVQANLTKQLQTRGLSLEATSHRLATFNAVQNTYIGIFTVLGGLGVLLGTAGLGVLAMRNVLERRGEFGLMQAIGFKPASLRRMVFGEHAVLLLTGMLLGIASALLAVWPNLQQSGGMLPSAFLVWLAAAILVFGFLVCWLSAISALRGRLLDALRQE